MEQSLLTKRERRELAKNLKQQERERQNRINFLKKFSIGLASVLVLGFLGVRVYNFFKSPAEQVLSQSVEVLANDWIRGNDSAKVTLFEYADFQCPACANYETILKRLLQEFPEDLRIVYRHFPLITIHRNAYSSSRASEAAGKQGKFWEMHDLLYERQEDWEGVSNAKEVFSQYAKEIGLDEEKFKNDFDSKEVEDKINRDISLGNSLRLNSTPTFILNNQRIQPRSYEEFRQLIEKANRSS